MNDGLLDDTAARLFAAHATQDVLADAERGVWPGALWGAIKEAGLHQALLPEAAGGFGVPPAEALGVLRQAGAAAAPAPLAETMLAGWLLAGAGLEVPEGPLGLAAGDGLTLRQDGAGWRLQGRAGGVAWGRRAAAVAAVAAVGGQPFVAALRPETWRAEPGRNVAGEPRDTIIVDAKLAAADVAQAGLSPVQARAAGAVTRALLIAGALQRVLDMTVRYANERRQFGKPIGRFQAVQQNLALLAGHAAAAAAAADMGADAFAAGLRLPGMAVAKARAGEAAGAGAAIAHQVHGAIGFTYEHSLHVLTRRLWSWRDEWGGEAEWSLLLGRLAASSGGPGLWAQLTAIDA